VFCFISCIARSMLPSARYVCIDGAPWWIILTKVKKV
jgi:hypothetical protein